MLHNAAVSDKGEQKVYIFFGIIKSFKEKLNDFWEMCKIWWSKRRKLIIFVKMESDMWLVKVKCFKNIFFFHHVVSMDLPAHSLLYVHTHTHTHKYCQGIIRCDIVSYHKVRCWIFSVSMETPLYHSRCLIVFLFFYDSLVASQVVSTFS